MHSWRQKLRGRRSRLRRLADTQAGSRSTFIVSSAWEKAKDATQRNTRAKTHTWCSCSCQSSHVLLPSDAPRFVGLIVGCLVVLRLDDCHVPVGGRRLLGRLLQHLVVRCLVWSSSLRYHVCRKTCVLSCFRDASWVVTSRFEAVFGPPLVSVVTAPVYRWCPCLDSLG